MFLLVHIKYLVSLNIFQKLNNDLKWVKVKSKKMIKYIFIIYLVYHIRNLFTLLKQPTPLHPPHAETQCKQFLAQEQFVFEVHRFLLLNLQLEVILVRYPGDYWSVHRCSIKKFFQASYFI